MSKDFENQDPLAIAQQAERDLNSNLAGAGANNAKASRRGQGDESTLESGVDTSVEDKFPGAQVSYGSEASGAGGNRDMPEGGINPQTGQPYKARDFEGVGGPEDKARIQQEENPGDNMIRDNVRQQKEPQPFVSK